MMISEGRQTEQQQRSERERINRAIEAHAGNEHARASHFVNSICEQTRHAALESRTHMADDGLKAELERLRAENERLKSQRGRAVSLKVSEKGGVSVYGLGRFPVTLYKEQWTKLLAMADEIRAFIKEHEAKLKAKPEA
jgi:hypothetical protein